LDETKELRQAITIAAPIDTVWAEITRIGAKQRAVLDSVLDTTFVPGDPVYYRSEDGTRVFVVGRVVECTPPTTFSHTQILTMRDDPLTTVTWNLEAVDGGTRVTLVHSGWPKSSDPRKVDKTWAGILATLKSVVETGDISGSDKAKYWLMRTFMFAMPAKTKADNVSVPD
jgi:uncharacterized protein YndB with AHSA1/START domain